MKATYDPQAKTSYTTSHRKEGKCFFHSYQIISMASPTLPSGLIYSHIEARLYGTGNLNTCCLWVRSEGNHTQGSGKAGGYGYHRPSAAVDQAIRNAGFTLSASITGVGDSAIREALMAVAKALKIKRPALIESYQ